MEDGCAKMTFLVPRFIIQSKFPLLKEQCESFCSLDALTLTAVVDGIDQYHIDFRSHVSVSAPMMLMNMLLV